MAYRRHPAADIVERTLVQWFGSFGSLLDSWADLRAAWRRLYMLVASDRGTALWPRVHGPNGALIATLIGYGWHAPMLEIWRSPSGGTLALDFAVPPLSFVRLVIADVTETLWRKAARHYQGIGLEQGVHQLSFALHASWLRSSAVWVVGRWSP